MRTVICFTILIMSIGFLGPAGTPKFIEDGQRLIVATRSGGSKIVFSKGASERVLGRIEHIDLFSQRNWPIVGKMMSQYEGQLGGGFAHIRIMISNNTDKLKNSSSSQSTSSNSTLSKQVKEVILVSPVPQKFTQILKDLEVGSEFEMRGAFVYPEILEHRGHHILLNGEESNHSSHFMVDSLSLAKAL